MMYMDGAGLKSKLCQMKEGLQLRYYYAMVGIVIGTIIIIVVNVIRKVYNRLQSIPENEECNSFKNTTARIILLIGVVLNFYLIIPREVYTYRTYVQKLQQLKSRDV